MGYDTYVKFKVTPAEQQPPAKRDNKMDEMVRHAALDSNWMWKSEWYHGPDWREFSHKLIEKVERLAETHGDFAWDDVTTISGERMIEYWKSSGDEFADTMKEHFGHGPDYDVEWTHGWEAEITTDEDRKELRELLDYFEPELDKKYYIPMGFVGKITIDAERR